MNARDVSGWKDAVLKPAMVCMLMFALCPQALAGKVYYVESDEPIRNPERGFYKLYAPISDGTKNINTIISESQMAADRDAGFSVIRHVWILPKTTRLDGKPMNLPTSLLREIEDDFAKARRVGIKIIPRFAYTYHFRLPTDQGKDTTTAEILHHIGGFSPTRGWTQLSRVFQENADVICVVEGAFFGRFGENWGSTSGNHQISPSNTTSRYNGNSVAIVNRLLNAVPASRMIAVRYPKTKWLPIFYPTTGYDPTGTLGGLSHPAATPGTAYNRSAASRIGYFNQGFMSRDFEWEEMSNADWDAYLKLDTQFVPMFGEPGGLPENPTDEDRAYGHSGEEMLRQAETYHWSMMNRYQWDALSDGTYAAWERQGALAELQKRLGYRFVLVNSDAPSSVSREASFDVDFRVKNVGFSRPFNPRYYELVFRDLITGVETRHKTYVDVRMSWPGPGETQGKRIRVPAFSLTTGTYSIHLNLPDSSVQLANSSVRGSYAIRFANEGLWDQSTGYNAMKQNIVVY
jgi:hypothetical protein